MENKFLKTLKEIFHSGCAIFTFVVFGFYIMGDILSSTTKVLELKTLFLLFLFSLWFALSNRIFTAKKMNVILRTVFHFLSTIIGFFVIFIYLPGNIKNSSSAFVLTLGFAVIYVVIAAIILTVRHFSLKKRNSEEKYDSVYEKDSKNQNND